MQALVVFALLVASLPASQAVTWNITKFVQQPGLNIRFGIPDDSPDWSPCQNPGICKPYTINVPANTIWYWCGFRAEYRTQYWLKVLNDTTTNLPGANVTGLLMRSNELYNCAMVSPSNIAQCGQIDTSLCDTSPKCYQQIVGLVFKDELCLVVANNDPKGTATNVTVQIWNFEDHARNVGTVFVILITVIWALSITAYFVIGCRNQWRKPTHRLEDMLALERKLSIAADKLPTEEHQETFKEKFEHLKQRLNTLVARNAAAPGSS